MALALHCLALLPFLCLLLTIACFRTRGDWLYAIIRGSLLWGLLVYVQVNVLSLFTAITFTPVLVFWLLWSVIAVIWLWPRRASLQWCLPKGRMMLGVYLIAGLTLLTGLLYPPNNWDAMTYNMPRVMHWMQNQSLSTWTTSIDRQITTSPLASMVILQGYILSKTDILANLPQWFAWGGTLFIVWCICNQIGGNYKARLISVFFMATLPMGILQASNTECSLIVTFYLCCFLSLVLEWKKNYSYSEAIWIGIAVGLAILSKGSAYPLGAATVIFMAILCCKNINTLKQGAVTACIIVLLQAPHLIRVALTYGHPLASSESMMVMPYISLGTFFANISSHFLMNIPLWSIDSFRELYADFLSMINININDSMLYPWGNPIDNISRFYTTEDSRAQNTFHAILLFFVALLISFNRKKISLFYISLVVFTFILFSVMLTWFPYITRIHITLYAFAAPCVGIMVSSVLGSRLKNIISIFLLVSALPALILNVNRPILPQELIQIIWERDARDCWRNSREILYFNARSNIRETYISCADAVSKIKPTVLGLCLGEDGWEYPLWVLLQNRMHILPAIVHSTTKNDRQSTPQLKEKNPDLIFEFSETNTKKSLPSIRYLDN